MIEFWPGVGMPDVRYEAPRTIAEAVQLMSEHPAAAPLAGGTDLLIQFNAGAKPVSAFVELKRIPELIGISTDAGGLRLGAATAAAAICEHPEVGQLWPGFVDAVRLIGSAQIQGRSTVGGNLCNGSPAADTTS